MRAFQSGDPRWMTYQQASQKGWQVKKGERATTIFFYKPISIEDEKAEDGTRTIPILKHFAVFHASQVDGISPFIPPNVIEAPWRRPEAAQIILENSRAVVRTGGDKPFYAPNGDFIQLPPDNAFRGPEYWATTALHELGHWTGHPTRLNREMNKKYGSAGYAMEELRAELSSAFIAGELGIPADIPNHASYIQSWLKPLKDSKHEIFRAAADAQRIVDMVLGFHPDFAANINDRPTVATRPSNPESSATEAQASPSP
jgi:antirestriction protein ArdC